MKTIATILIAFLSLTAMAQDKYEAGMQKAFDLWDQDKTSDAINVFERIATVETKNWKPAYYVSLLNVLESFGEKDEAVLIAKLNKAQDFMNNAKSLASNNVDVMMLEGLYYTAWVAYDGQRYGMQYSSKISKLYKEASKLEPDNPRVVLGRAEWNIGLASYFKQPIDAFCEDIERAIKLGKDWKPTEKFAPSFQEDRAKEVLKKSCGK